MYQYWLLREKYISGKDNKEKTRFFGTFTIDDSETHYILSSKSYIEVYEINRDEYEQLLYNSDCPFQTDLRKTIIEKIKKDKPNLSETA